MALAFGTRLGAYEIVSLLASGGMGEVYRARDTKLDRDVAIKVLPEPFVSDPERVARFQREAKTLAALSKSLEPRRLPNVICGRLGDSDRMCRPRVRRGRRSTSRLLRISSRSGVGG
jgi:serine/threonine protein kinase